MDALLLSNDNSSVSETIQLFLATDASFFKNYQVLKPSYVTVDYENSFIYPTLLAARGNFRVHSRVSFASLFLRKMKDFS